ncbi:hypothetical protein [Paenibacillus graminis]|uniref:Uncharacterized protein n=1 Tax=Paenibacillus graminis TaxID=189425 RepID=A0A089MDC2_9BACL|nr:hypothetical protein [Paenibacillus graminis]AIQ70360.1 hypothetical protein PGRAT_24050 [Paenibacillus graminis]MEC0169722.1 hypothetical protein [Paenibacillus graminis]
MEENQGAKEEIPELEKLIKEKIRLAKKLGITGEDASPVGGYELTDEFKRMKEIDLRLWELVK